MVTLLNDKIQKERKKRHTIDNTLATVEKTNTDTKRTVRVLKKKCNRLEVTASTQLDKLKRKAFAIVEIQNDYVDLKVDFKKVHKQLLNTNKTNKPNKPQLERKKERTKERSMWWEFTLAIVDGATDS
eukprot:1564489-Ditylum_brightwellii.AAC.1